MSNVAPISIDTTAPQPGDYFSHIPLWKTAQAGLRNVVGVVLRKYGYPQGLQDQVAEQVLALAKLTEGGKQ